MLRLDRGKVCFLFLLFKDTRLDTPSILHVSLANQLIHMNYGYFARGRKCRKLFMMCFKGKTLSYHMSYMKSTPASVRFVGMVPRPPHRA